MYDRHNKINSLENMTGAFELIGGKNNPTTSLPLNAKIGGQIISDKYVSKEQARLVYKM